MEALINKFGQGAFVDLQICLELGEVRYIFLLLDSDRKNITGFSKRDGMYSIHLYRDRDFKQEILTASEDDYYKYLSEAVENHNKYEVYETPKA